MVEGYSAWGKSRILNGIYRMEKKELKSDESFK